MNSESNKLFPLPKHEESRFETKRTLVGLYKQGPLETTDQFAERIVREIQEHLAKSRQRRNTMPESVVAFGTPRMRGAHRRETDSAQFS